MISDKERKEFTKAMRAYTKEHCKSKEASKDYLVKVGILMPKGNLRKPYRNLCILRDLG